MRIRESRLRRIIREEARKMGGGRRHGRGRRINEASEQAMGDEIVDYLRSETSLQVSREQYGVTVDDGDAEVFIETGNLPYTMSVAVKDEYNWGDGSALAQYLHKRLKSGTDAVSGTDLNVMN